MNEISEDWVIAVWVEVDRGYGDINLLIVIYLWFVVNFNGKILELNFIPFIDKILSGYNH